MVIDQVLGLRKIVILSDIDTVLLYGTLRSLWAR